MAELDPGVLAGVINANFKVISEMTTAGLAQAGSLSAQNAVAHQHGLNLVQQSVLTEALMQRAGIDVSEGTATKKVAEADLSRSVSELGAAIAALQQIIKGAQTTPPVTP